MGLGAKLNELRRRKGLSLQQVADAVKISKPHLWQLERGESKNPTLEVLQRLAKFFDTTVSALLDEEETNMVFGRGFAGEVDEDTKSIIIKMAEKLIEK